MVLRVHRLFAMVLVVASLVLAAAGALAVPEVEKEFTDSGGFRFAGVAGNDQLPDLAEVLTDGTVRVVFYDTQADTAIARAAWPDGYPSWGAASSDTTRWPFGNTVGDLYLTLVADIPRPLDLRGTGADSCYVTFVDATYAITSFSKAR